MADRCDKLDRIIKDMYVTEWVRDVCCMQALGIKVGYQNRIGVVAVSRASQFSKQHQQALPCWLHYVTSYVTISHGMCQDDIALGIMMSSQV